jgi:hypothetical protein
MGLAGPHLIILGEAEEISGTRIKRAVKEDAAWEVGKDDRPNAGWPATFPKSAVLLPLQRLMHRLHQLLIQLERAGQAAEEEVFRG